MTYFKGIASYGIMSIWGLVIDDKVVSYGKVPKPKEIVKILEKINKYTKK